MSPPDSCSSAVRHTRLVQHVHYQSTAELVLVPVPSSSAEMANLTGSFANSGTLGTYVEYISSINPEPKAGGPPVSLSVRGVPDTRAIDVTTTGPAGAVRGALQNVITVAENQASQLNDAWSLHTLKNAGSPSQSGPGGPLIVLAAALLAVLAAVCVYAILDRFTVTRPVSRPASHPDNSD